jgi:hypothetical protein
MNHEQLMAYYWTIAIWIYSILAFVTFLPVLVAILKKVKLNPGGDTFDTSPHFSKESKELLKQHFSRIHGTLVFWKNKAEWHKRFHFYTLCWTIPVSILIPIIAQSLDITFESKLFLTIISTHSALLVAFHRALKVENNFKAFRHGESEFYDLFRQLLDRPKTFGDTEEKQIEKYFSDVDFIRRTVRIAETDNFPMIDDIKGKE